MLPAADVSILVLIFCHTMLVFVCGFTRSLFVLWRDKPVHALVGMRELDGKIPLQFDPELSIFEIVLKKLIMVFVPSPGNNEHTCMNGRRKNLGRDWAL